MKKAEDYIKAELKRRLDLVENENFRLKCIEFCKKVGVTAKEWNENKTEILMYLANQFCALENELRQKS